MKNLDTTVLYRKLSSKPIFSKVIAYVLVILTQYNRNLCNKKNNGFFMHRHLLVATLQLLVSYSKAAQKHPSFFCI